MDKMQDECTGQTIKSNAYGAKDNTSKKFRITFFIWSVLSPTGLTLLPLNTLKEGRYLNFLLIIITKNAYNSRNYKSFISNGLIKTPIWPA